MWIIFGVGAIITMILNIGSIFARRETKWFRFISMSLTLLTLCSVHSLDSKWVLAEDWSALMDVVPTMTSTLWSLSLASIALNSVSLFVKPKKAKGAEY